MNLLNPKGKDHLVWVGIAIAGVILMAFLTYSMWKQHRYKVAIIDGIATLANLCSAMIQYKLYIIWKKTQWLKCFKFEPHDRTIDIESKKVN